MTWQFSGATHNVTFLSTPPTGGNIPDQAPGNSISRTLTVTDDPRVHHVVADANLSAGILANLLSNAIKYAPESSPVHVTTTLDGDRVVTTVSDAGPGIPPGDRERIFDKFTRLGDHLTRPQQGVGLGLYIARRSIDEMGGEIWCDEGPGGGARFGFSLPTHQGAETDAAPTEPGREALRS